MISGRAAKTSVAFRPCKAFKEQKATVPVLRTLKSIFVPWATDVLAALPLIGYALDHPIFL